jgi:phage shock protein PspC (stress-responsive transcriptional regulator)
MQKVISINLNGNAYQLEESGYEALRDYLSGAEGELEGNPDRTEIIADLEQAIADKCRKFLGAHKSVVSAGEVRQIIKEMGPIDAEPGQDAANGKEAAGKDTPPHSTEPAMKRLYRNPDGAMIAGVCSGLAAYFGIDVTLVRILFVIAVVLSKGAAIIIYIGMMFVVPEATTAEERAAAGGLPFNAKEVIQRARRQYTEGTRHWQRQLREQQRRWRRGGWTPGMPMVYAQPPWTAPLAPLFGLVHLALFLTMAAMMISLVNTGGVLDWRLPPDVPVWAGAIALLIGYQIVVSPIRAVQHWSWRPQADGQPNPYAFWNAVVWLIGMFLVLWIASSHVPEIREFVQRLPPVMRDFAEAVRNFMSRHH